MTRLPPGWREWSGPVDTSAIQRLAGRLWPAGPHPGGLGWAQAIEQLAGRLVLVGADGSSRAEELVGWGGVSQPGNLLLQVAPGRYDVAADLLGWSADVAEGAELNLEVFTDEARTAALGAGFTATAVGPAGFHAVRAVGLQAAVGDVVAAGADGYVVRSVRPGESAARVAVHRTAWRPVDLPFDPAHRPELDESWTSSFDAECYRRVRRTLLYDTELDLVAVNGDGALVGCCLGWYDPETGWAEIEPLGVVPAHRRRGLAGALCAEVARRVAALGGQRLFINTGPSISYPAPDAAYAKAGFVPFPRSESYVRATVGV